MQNLATFDEVVELLAQIVQSAAQEIEGPITHQEVFELLWVHLEGLPAPERRMFDRRVWADMLEGFVKHHLSDAVRTGKLS